MRRLTLLLILVSTTVFGEDSAHRLDWVEWADLSDVRRTELHEYCEGAYVEPTFAQPLSSSPSDFPLEVSASSAEVWIDERAVLLGNVHLQQGNRSFSTDAATIYNADQRVVAEGDVILREPDFLVLGESAEMYLDTGVLQMTDAEFLLHDHQIRGRASSITRDENAMLQGTQTRFTRCEPGNNGWAIDARTIEVEDGAQWGVARSAVVRVKDVPIFYTPYLRFPVTDERMSGFLFPSLRFGDEGADIGLPYYLNLAPNYDALIEPRWIEDRGVGVQVEFRHLSSWAETELGGAFLYDDDLYNGQVSKDDFDTLGLPGSFDPANRWLGHAWHDGSLGDFRTLVDYTEVSDDDYFRDLGTDLSVSSRVALNQTGELEYSAGGLFARFWAQGFQNLDETVRDPYDRLPELAMTYQGDLVGPFEWSLGTSVSRFNRGNDSRNVGIEALNGDRFHVEPRLQLPIYWPSGFVRLNGGYR
jgi:LPS-assembly protein